MSLVRRPCRATSPRVGSNPRFAPGHPRAGPSLPSALAPRPDAPHTSTACCIGGVGPRGAEGPPPRRPKSPAASGALRPHILPGNHVCLCRGRVVLGQGQRVARTEDSPPGSRGRRRGGRTPEPLGQMRPDITPPCSPDARGKGFPAAQFSFPRRKMWPHTGVCGRNGKGEFESPCRRPSAKLEPLFLKITPRAVKLWLLKDYLRRGSRRRIRELLILC